MLYKGKATCKRHGEFEWQIAESEKNKIIIGKDFISKNMKTYDKCLKIVIASCPECGVSIEITDYNFDKTSNLL